MDTGGGRVEEEWRVSSSFRPLPSLDGIIPDSGLTGLNNTHTHTHIYIYIYIYIWIYVGVSIPAWSISRVWLHWRVVCLWMTIYTLPSSGGVWAFWRRNITVAARVTQSPSNEMNTPVSDSAKCKQTKLDTYALIPRLTLSCRFGLEACHQPDAQLGGFWSWLGASSVSNHIEEL